MDSKLQLQLVASPYFGVGFYIASLRVIRYLAQGQ